MLIFDSGAHVVLGLDTNSFSYLSSKFRRKLHSRLYRFAVYVIRFKSIEFRLTKLKTVSFNKSSEFMICNHLIFY